MTQPKRLDRPLNSLRLPSPVSEASLDALREPSEELESADRPRRRQELLSPITDFVAGIGLMPLDIVGKVWLLIGAIVDRQGLGGGSSIEFSGLRRQKLKTDDALEPHLFRAARKPGNPDMIAERILNEAQADRFRANLDSRLDYALIMGVARAQHHSMLAKSNRLPIA